MGLLSLKFDIVTVAAVGALLALIVLGAAMFGPAFDNPRLVISEAPLSKNARLGIYPGESFVYEYRANGSSANVTFLALEGEGCTKVAVLEDRGASAVCLDPAGNDASMSNATFENPGMLIFKPWMLALREGWRWNTTMFLSLGGSLEHVGDVGYRVIRMDNLSGTMAYLVEIRAEGGEPEYDWVDAEKRILLKTQGEGYEVVLVR